MKRKAVIISQIVACSLLCLSIHLGMPKEQEVHIQTQEPTISLNTIKTTVAPSKPIEAEYTYELITYWGGHLIFNSAIKECIIQTDGSNFKIKDERYECTRISDNQYKITFIADSWTCPVSNILFHVDSNFTYLVFESFSANKTKSEISSVSTTENTVPSLIVPDNTTSVSSKETSTKGKTIPVPGDNPKAG